MATSVWKQLGSPNLSPSTITLHGWDGHLSQPIVLFHNYLVMIADKALSIDHEIIDAPLDYNIILGCSYTYFMLIVAFLVHHNMFFPHNGKIITINQFMYLTPKPRLHLNPTFLPWLTIRLSRPFPMSLQDFLKTPIFLVLTVVHHLLLLSLSNLVFAFSKLRTPPTNGLVCLHSR